MGHWAFYEIGFLYRAFFLVKDFEEADFADEAICFGILDFDTWEALLRALLDEVDPLEEAIVLVSDFPAKMRDFTFPPAELADLEIPTMAMADLPPNPVDDPNAILLGTILLLNADFAPTFEPNLLFGPLLERNPLRELAPFFLLVLDSQSCSCVMR